MGERGSSLFSKLTLRSKRQAANVSSAAASSSSSSRSARSPLTTPEVETPDSFSGPADYGLGYSSIDHERSPKYRSQRNSTIVLPTSVEHDRCADVSWKQKQRSLPRSYRLNTVQDEESPLFVEIDHEATPKPIVHSTVRARSRTRWSPPDYDAFDLPRPQSPFVMAATVSHSCVRSPPTRSLSYDDSNRAHIPRSATLPLAAETASTAVFSNKCFYAVARGWKKGIYESKDEADRHTRNFPGPCMQVFHDRTAAEDFLDRSGRTTPQPSFPDEAEDELVERTRIFKGLDPQSEAAKRRTMSMYVERKESQRRSRIHIAMHSPVLHQDAAAHSPPLSLKSIFADNAPVSPIDEINGFGKFPAPVTMQAMTMLPVTHLARSMLFYAMVLDLTCVSHIPQVQAVMSSPAATICLRTTDHASPSSDGANVLRISTLARPSLPTMCEDITTCADALPLTPESLSLPSTDPEPLELPSTSIPLDGASFTSGAIVLIEHNGSLDALHTRLTARLNEWRLSPSSLAKGSVRVNDNAKLLAGVQHTAWNAQELHLCDLDGHRVVFTTPFPR